MYMCMALVQSEEIKNLAENCCQKFVNNSEEFLEISNYGKVFF